MKKISTKITTGLLVIFLVVSLVTPTIGRATDAPSPELRLLVTEVAATRVSAEEWIEIYNPSSIAVDLTGLIVFEDETRHGTTIVRGNSLLPSHGLAIIANKGDIFIEKYPEYQGVVLDSSWSSLKEEGEALGLQFGQITVDSVMYGASSGDEVAERAGVADTWVRGIMSPGILSDAQRNVFEPTILLEETDMEDETPPTVQSTETEIITEPESEPEQMAETPTVEPPAPAANPTSQNAAPSSPAPQPAPVIINTPPVAMITIQSGSLTGTEKVSINFDGRNSYDPNGDALRYEWDFGDGVLSPSANPGSHTYSVAATYRIQLSVIDTGGLRGVAYQTVTVHAKPLTTPPPSTAVQSAPAQVPHTVASSIDVPTAAPIATPENNEAYLSSSTDIALVQAHAILINELLPIPEKGAPEWIELYNPTEVAVSLSGWLLGDTAKAKNPFIFPVSAVVPPLGYLIIENDVSKISLNNGEDSVYLATPNGTVIDAVTYSGAKKLHSYARAASAATSDGDINASSNARFFWTADVTKGKKNKTLSTIEGTVTAVRGGSKEKGTKPTILIEEATGITTVSVDDQDTSGEVTKGFFEPGADVSLAAYQGDTGDATLAEVEKITSPIEFTNSSHDSQRTPAPETKEINRLIPLIAILAVGNTGVIGFFMYRYLREKKLHTERQLITD